MNWLQKRVDDMQEKEPYAVSLTSWRRETYDDRVTLIKLRKRNKDYFSRKEIEEWEEIQEVFRTHKMRVDIIRLWWGINGRWTRRLHTMTKEGWVLRDFRDSFERNALQLSQVNANFDQKGSQANKSCWSRDSCQGNDIVSSTGRIPFNGFREGSRITRDFGRRINADDDVSWITWRRFYGTWRLQGFWMKRWRRRRNYRRRLLLLCEGILRPLINDHQLEFMWKRPRKNRVKFSLQETQLQSHRPVLSICVIQLQHHLHQISWGYAKRTRTTKSMISNIMMANMTCRNYIELHNNRDKTKWEEEPDGHHVITKATQRHGKTISREVIDGVLFAQQMTLKYRSRCNSSQVSHIERGLKFSLTLRSSVELFRREYLDFSSWVIKSLQFVFYVGNEPWVLCDQKVILDR